MGDLVHTSTGRYDAIMSVEDAVGRRAMMVEFTSRVMVPDVDYGVIPGTQKPTLLKPGAEKLCTLFGLVPRFEIVREIEDWQGDKTGGEPLFYYLYRCSLYRNGELIAQGDGSANSREKKHRYRNSERVCPDCAKATLRKSKQGDGFFCWAKLGGCGGTFGPNDVRIIDQVIGQIPNPDVFDLLNTLQKMSQKRALVAATLIGVNASEFYTQDIEDFAEHATPSPPPPPADDNSVREAADREAAERAEAARKSEAKAQQQEAAKAAFAAFTAKAYEYGFDNQSRPALQTLAVTICRKDKPGTADLVAALDYEASVWGEAIDEVNSLLEQAAKTTSGAEPPAEVTPEVTPAESAATVGAMSR